MTDVALVFRDVFIIITIKVNIVKWWGLSNRFVCLCTSVTQHAWRHCCCDVTTSPADCGSNTGWA